MIQTRLGGLAHRLEHLVPILEAAAPVDVFADPFADADSEEVRHSLVVLDDGVRDPQVAEASRTLLDAAEARGVRVQEVTSEADGDLARYAALLATGHYAATYLRVGRAG